jgi:hypothetical protein
MPTVVEQMMRELEELVPPPAQDPLPPVQYHYTTRPGLLGMLKNGCVWATNYRHLNDRTELSAGEDIARKVISDLRGNYQPKTAERHLIDIVHDSFDKVALTANADPQPRVLLRGWRHALAVARLRGRRDGLRRGVRFPGAR